MAEQQHQTIADCAPPTVISHTTRRSMSFGKMALAMAKAQGSMKGALKDATNPFFQSKYADLASVWDDCRQPLSANEIAVLQMPSASGAKVTITTLLAHSSGEWVEGDLEMKSKDESPQGIGSVISYARRYALAAMTGVYQIDDDAESAQPRNEIAGAPGESGRPSEPQRESHSRAASVAPPPAMPAPVSVPGEKPEVPRPGGMFSYGKKFKETPWNVMTGRDLEWFLNAERTPNDIRHKIVSEMAWRDYETSQMERIDDETRKDRERPLDDDIP